MEQSDKDRKANSMATASTLPAVSQPRAARFTRENAVKVLELIETHGWELHYIGEHSFVLTADQVIKVQEARIPFEELSLSQAAD